MAEGRGLLRRWRCARIRPLLVDCAEGALAGEVRERVERHAAECDECRDALTALREVPQALRGAPIPVRDEEFFRRQREAILRRVRQVPSAQAAPAFRPRFGWMAGLATAAVVALVLLRQPSEPPVVVPRGEAIEGLAPDDVADLTDLTVASDADLVDSAGLADDLLASGEAPDEGEEWAPAPDVHDLSDQELERLEELIG